jgi:alpha-tubulin suppressor-like RCC1 family protein/pimeloyl-ACP methyl ester carboxylesterase
MRHLKTIVSALSLVLIHCGSERMLDSAGKDDTGGTVQPLGTTSTVTVAGGGFHACSLFNGKVLCWGANSYGQLGNGTTTLAYAPTAVSAITTATQVASGDNHTCALLSTGSVQCWGLNSDGQLGNGTTTNALSPVTVSGITTATSIAVGRIHSCARLSNGTVKCWGANLDLEMGNGTWTSRETTPVQVSNITTASTIAGGGYHTCAILTDATIKCWGLNSQGQLGPGNANLTAVPVTVSGIGNASSIALGYSHTCAVLTNSTLKCWGYNNNGQIGDNTTTRRTSPITVSGITTATNVGLGDYHTCVRLSDSTLKCWGKNDLGELGNGTTSNALTPVAVSGISNAADVGGGTGFTCAGLDVGGIKCWGANESGQLGRGTAQLQMIPALVDGNNLNKILDVVSGFAHTCVLWDSGSVKCWGENTHGQLGNGTTDPSTVPVDVLGITNAVAIAAGSRHNCVILSGGTVKCWGNDLYGQLGNNTAIATYSTPVTVTGISSAAALGLGPRHSCAVLTDGTVKCWGRNIDGELGNGKTNNYTMTPVSVSGITNAVSVAGGGDGVPDAWPLSGDGSSCAVLSTGGLKCWGDNSYGQIGNGNTVSQSSPVDVTGLTSGVAKVALGTSNTCAVKTDGTMKCWGRNNYGQLGNGNNTNSSTPVSVSGISNGVGVTSATYGDHACAVLSDKTVKCWGYNATGQLGNGVQTDSNVPVTALGLTRAVKVAAGASHTCARRDDSTIECWGDNTSSQIVSTYSPSNSAPQALPCTAMDVERSDYFISITTANMPDSSLNGLSASLDGHRVKPVMFPTTCPIENATLLVHGRTVEAVSAFDLQFEDYSAMEQLAREGIDTFTFNHLGMGRSSGLGVMNDACNASLPACTSIGQTCPPPPGVLCDCGPTATFRNTDIDQQGSTRYLNPNPLASRCAHTFNTRFTRTAAMVDSLDAAVDDALSKSGLSQLTLLGYSAGGIDVGNYLGDANATVRAAHTAKVVKAVFVSSLFGTPQVTGTEPGGATGAHSFPFGVMDRGSATQGGFNLDPVNCPGQRDDDIVDPIWASVIARDTVGATWGPAQTPSQNGGLSRFPHATRWGWDSTSAARVTVPVLVMQGLLDNVVPVASSSNLYAALTGTSSKTIVQLGCASHSIFWEGCSGSQCNGWTGPHATIRKNVRDWVKTGLIYASPGSANGSFESTATDGTNTHTGSPSSSGPTADESNQTP